MPTDILKDLAINELLDSPVGEWIAKAMETISVVQRTLFAISESDDSKQFTLMKIGTVFQIFLIDALAEGKRPEELTEEDWRNIADKVAKYVILEDGQTYSEFVFTLYADYIELSAKVLRSKKVPKEKAEEVKKIADEIRYNAELLQNEDLTEVEYVDKCLWLSLEAMIKCLSLSLSSLIGPEFAQFAQSVSQLAFEYGRYVLYSKEQALLQAYIENQYVLDEVLQKKYEDYLSELQLNSDRFLGLIDKAFSSDLHEALVNSADLARAYGVKEEEILKTVDDVDDFFLN